MRAKYIGITAALAVAAVGITACGGSATYKDGTYEGKSEVYDYAEEDGTDEGNGYGVATITIEGGKITDCKFVTYEPDGTLKDEEYGKKQGSVANRDFYNKAQKAASSPMPQSTRPNAGRSPTRPRVTWAPTGSSSLPSKSRIRESA